MRSLHRHERYIVTSVTSATSLRVLRALRRYSIARNTSPQITHRFEQNIAVAARCRKHSIIAGISSWQAEHPSKQHHYRLTLLCAKLISSPLPVRHHLGEKCFKAGAMISNEQMAHFMHYHIFQTFRRIQRQTSIDANFSR